MNEKARILVVDDEPVVRESLQSYFTEDGYVVETAADAKEALRTMQSQSWDLLLVDIRMPGMDGLELHRKAKQIDPEAVVIIMTAFASVDTAVRALKDGVYDYVTKPIDPDDLERVISKGLEQRRLVVENRQLKEKLEAVSTEKVEAVIGESREIEEMRASIRTVADTDATVLILGESGTGKELAAKAIHGASARRHMPLVVVHCAGVPDGLIESELFGHEKGAFTGAEYKRKGKFELADGGTIFFDEIGEVAPKTQVDLLRVLEEKTFSRVGSNEVIQADFRVIAATNRDLAKEVEEGRFRLDLYYRINVFSIALPPLRSRRSDIPRLADHFLLKSARAMGRRACRLSPEAIDLLTTYDWPGNVRELENVIERAVIVQKGEAIGPDDLALKPRAAVALDSDLSLEELEKRHIQAVLIRLSGNVSRAAEALGIDRVTLYSKIRKYGLKRQG